MNNKIKVYNKVINIKYKVKYSQKIIIMKNYFFKNKPLISKMIKVFKNKKMCLIFKITINIKY